MSTTFPGGSRGLPGARGRVPQQVGSPKARVHPGQASRGANERHVGDSFEVLGDGPQIDLARHPAEAVEARQVDRSAVTAEGQLALEIEIVLEIRHRQFAERAVDRLTGAQARELAGSDRAPEATAPIDRDDVVLVVNRAQVHDQRWVALDTQGGGREDRPLDAVGGPVAENPPWRPECLAIVLRVVWDVVEELLDLRGRLESPAERRQLVPGQLSEGTGHGLGGVPWAGRLWQNL